MSADKIRAAFVQNIYTSKHVLYDKFIEIMDGNLKWRKNKSKLVMCFFRGGST